MDQGQSRPHDDDRPIASDVMRWRSLLFVPANDDDRLAKVHLRGADGIILDLEDSVADEAKEASRQAIRKTILDLRDKGATLIVRINAPWRSAFADLDAVVGPGVAAIMVPKVERAESLSVLSAILSEFEAERGLESGRIRLIALIESPLALTDLADIAAAPRMAGLAFGTEDFALSLGVAPSSGVLDLPARQIALAAAARGMMSFAVPISISAFRDEVAYRAMAEAACAFGVTGAICIHPNQVRLANECFGHTDADRIWARSVLAAWDRAVADGRAVAELDGSMIDRPVVELARRILGESH